MKKYLKIFSRPIQGELNWEKPEFLNEHFDEIGIDYLKFVFSQSEKFLSESIKIGEHITSKSLKILSIAIAILTICLGYIFSNHQTSSNLLTASILTSFLSLSSVALLIKPLWVYKIIPLGSPPKLSFSVKEAITNFTSVEAQEKNAILNECVRYQERIDFNQDVNSSRIKYMNTSIVCLLLIPFTFPISWYFNLGWISNNWIL